MVLRLRQHNIGYTADGTIPHKDTLVRIGVCVCMGHVA